MLPFVLAAVDQTTVNPNTADAWLGRIYTVCLIIAALYGAWRVVKRSLHHGIDDVVKFRTDAVVRELREHTDQEASIVRREVNEAIAPVSSQVAVLSTQMHTYELSRQTLLEELRGADARQQHEIDELRSQR